MQTRKAQDASSSTRGLATLVGWGEWGAVVKVGGSRPSPAIVFSFLRQETLPHIVSLYPAV